MSRESTLWFYRLHQCSLSGFSAARKLDTWIPQKLLWKSTLGVSPSYSVMDTSAFRAETTQQLVQPLPDNPRATALTKTAQFNFKYCVLSPSHSSAFSKLRGDLNFSAKSHKPVLCHCAHMELLAGRHITT